MHYETSDDNLMYQLGLNKMMSCLMVLVIILALFSNNECKKYIGFSAITVRIYAA